MKKTFYTLFLPFLLLTSIQAQEGCPGCVIDLPEELPADTAYLASAPDARVGEYYEADISFRLPKTTTPVADENTPPGLPIDRITVRTVANIPSGLNWEANQTEFVVADTTDGCVRICGVPLQPGYYEVEVVLTATVLVSTSTTSFSFPILVRQAVTETDGFTMFNNSGCGAVDVSFENRIPSNGEAGFSYLWDFGNGNYSVAEDPADQFYDQPGVYPVRYEAVVDTAGYTLTRIVVNEVGCDDTFNRPDLQVSVFDENEELVYQSEEFTNAIPPLTLDGLDLELEESNYLIQVVDIDDAIGGGGNDNCGIVNFNRYTSGKLADSDMSVTININHPVDTLRSSDTVFVFPQPAPPLVLGDFSKTLCAGDTLHLRTTYAENIQWYRDSVPLLEGDTSLLIIEESGDYWVQHTSPDGCIAVSEVRNVLFPASPSSPVFTNTSNELTLFDPDALPPFYALQWYFEGEPIEGATQTSYCVDETGRYRLDVLDLETGCSSTYQLPVTYDPKFPGCVSSTENALLERLEAFRMYPNPTSGQLWVEWTLPEPHDARFRLRTAQGQVMAETGGHLWGDVRQSLDLSRLPAGLYFLEITVDDELGYFRVVKQ